MASFTFGDPGLSTDSGPDFQDIFTGILLPTANLAANTFIANQAVTSKQPSSVSFLPNGQIQVANGGGGLASAGGILGTSTVWLFVFGILLFILLLKK